LHGFRRTDSGLDDTADRPGDSLQHRQRVTFVVSG
jgi:hypothetical protein